jgi:hypothetical protein
MPWPGKPQPANPKLTDMVLEPLPANQTRAECWRVYPREDERIHNFRVMITVANEG